MTSVSCSQIRVVLAMFVEIALLGSNTLSIGQVTITVGAGPDADFGTIQEGIDAAQDGDLVLVAAGEYVTTAPLTFQGKAITLRSEAGADKTTIRMGTPADPRRASVVAFENDETSETVLEGFTLRGGRGCWLTDPSMPAAGGLCGGGISCVASSPTIIACTVTKNTADNDGGMDAAYGASPTLIGCTITDNSVPGSGGGVSCWSNSSLTMIDCVISGNSATGTVLGVNGNGGGIFCGQNSELDLTRCRIIGNLAGINGAGISCQFNSILTMTHCTIANNTSRRWSGGIGSGHSSLTLTHCIVSQNTAALYCGGIETDFQDSSLILRNCTIVQNSAGQDGGGVYCWGGASLSVTNSIFSGNTAPVGPCIYLQTSPSTLNVTYSNFVGGRSGVHLGAGSTIDWGFGNIDTDPSFACSGHWVDVNDPNVVVEPDNANAIWIDSDYHLKSEAGRWDSHRESWVKDEVTSPCIDRGDPSSPIDSELIPNGGLINMGAYGGTSEASMSIGYPPPLPVIPVAHWKLDEAEGNTAFDDVGRNHALVIGTPVWRPDGGAVDGAIELDGTDDCLVADEVLNPTDGPFSVFAWIKGGGPGQVIVSQVGGEDWLRADSVKGTLATDLAPLSRISVPPLISDTVITDGHWHRVGFIWDGTSRALYVDGLLAAEDVQIAPENCLGDLNIGCGNDTVQSTFWSGLIDDLCIYDSAVMP